MNKKILMMRLAGSVLAITMSFSSVAYATVIVPPIGGEGSAAEGSVVTGPAAADPAAADLAATDLAAEDLGVKVTIDNIQKPVVQAEGAVLLDAATGKVLFGKNENTKFYPASITKIMTALLVLENCNLNDKVTFSTTATTNLESGSVSLAIVAGDQLTVEQSLHGLLLKSANEIANGLAEHVSGSIGGFAGQMNQRAKELGCLNTNFANPSGLNNSTHQTTPYDMALIARAAFQNKDFCRIDTTLSYQFPATKKQTARTITMGHKMMYPSDSRYYEGIIGGKTGYTSKAGNTLVTGVERDGIRLIAVVMKSASTHYTDTKALLDYGFENYAVLTDQTAPTAPDSVVSHVDTTADNVAEKGWQQDQVGWYYLNQNGQKISDQWLTIEGEKYWIDANSYMANGWRQLDDGQWYYFRSSGAMARNYWVESNGAWFYLGDDGVMLVNATTPDGYYVNEAGVWMR